MAVEGIWVHVERIQIGQGLGLVEQGVYFLVMGVVLRLARVFRELIVVGSCGVLSAGAFTASIYSFSMEEYEISFLGFWYLIINFNSLHTPQASSQPAFTTTLTSSFLIYSLRAIL